MSQTKLAIVPMDFYFGHGKGGDLPRRTSPTRSTRLLALMPKLEMTILVGAYATQSATSVTKSWPALTDVVLRLQAVSAHLLPAGPPLAAQPDVDEEGTPGSLLDATRPEWRVATHGLERYNENHV